MSEKKELILSETKIKSESTKLILQSNSSLIPIVGGIAGGAISYAAEFVLLAMAMGGLFTVGVIMLLVNMFARKDTFKSIYLSHYNKQLEKQNAEKREKIRRMLEDPTAQIQMGAFETKYEHFKKTLKKELSESSFSYQRLLGAFDQVYLMGVSKIEKILDYESNRSVINEANINRQIKELESKEVLKDFEEKQLGELQARLDLREEYAYKIQELLAQNDSALTKMDVLQSKLTDLHQPKNMMIALEELQTLATALDFEEKNAIKLD